MDLQSLLNGERIKFGNAEFCLRKQQDEGHLLECFGSDVGSIKAVCDALRAKLNHPFEINIYNSQCKDKYSVNYETLKEYSDSIFFKYGKDWDVIASYDEFIPYQRKLNKIREQMRLKELSPVEQLTMVYDYVKTKQYNMSDDESINGHPHYTLMGDKIVCRGYCLLMKELLFDILELSDITFNVYDKEGNFSSCHDRLLVILDDDKYDIHGCFMLDPTFDSHKDEYIGKAHPEYKPTDLYGYFLSPLTDPKWYSDEDLEYRILHMLSDDELTTKDVYFNQNQPELYSKLLSKSKDDISIFLENALNDIFKDFSMEQIRFYIEKAQIDFDTLKQVIMNVRLWQGMSKETIQKDIERIDEINRPFYTYGAPDDSYKEDVSTGSFHA